MPPVFSSASAASGRAIVVSFAPMTAMAAGVEVTDSVTAVIALTTAVPFVTSTVAVALAVGDGGGVASETAVCDMSVGDGDG